MGDDRLSEHREPVEFLNIYLGDNLQPHPGVHLRETCGRPDPPKPCGEQICASDPPDSVRQEAPPRGSSTEATHLGSGSSQGDLRQSQSTSTQVVFWAGILQAQMCVLDLEEELEKTEGLRAELRCCLPPASTDLPTFSSSPVGPRDLGLRPGPPVEEALGEDSSGPEGENQNLVWPGKGTPDSSPEWGAEEESVFFDNPLFLDSPCSDASASEERFSWGFPDFPADVRTGTQSPQTLEPLVPGGGVPWELEGEPGLGDGTSDSSGHTTPPFPVPIYRPHSLSWAAGDAADGAPAVPPGQGENEVSRALGTNECCARGHRMKGLPLWSPGPEHSFQILGPFGILE